MSDKSKIPQAVLAKIESRGETIQLGMAAASAAGLLAVLSLGDSDELTFWAGICFCMGLPCGLGRALMGFTSDIADHFMSPVSWLTYPLGWASCLPTLVGYTLICWHLSYIHGIVFLSCSLVSLLLMLAHARAVRRAKQASAQEAISRQSA